MQTESSGPPVPDGSLLERAVVMQLLRDDRARQWSRAELQDELAIEAHMLDAALQALDRDGVACVDGEQVSASRAVLRLDELELIGI